MTNSNANTGDGIARVIEGRSRDLGGFVVRRVLPSIEARMVGPFTFFDEMGPAVFSPGKGIDVRPHPHVGLSTVSYLFDGEIDHKDSLGSDQIIRPGDINWMVAGRGIVHSERTPANERGGGERLHGIQLWVAHPKKDEECAPAFTHHPRSALPEQSREGVELRVLAGTAYGMTSPVEVLSPLFYAVATMAPSSSLDLPDEHEERAVYVVDGAVHVGARQFTTGQMVVFTSEACASLRAEGKTRIALLGGAPLDGPRFLEWNFVSSSKERIERAKDDWRAGRFPKVPGDDVEFIPLPET